MVVALCLVVSKRPLATKARTLAPFHQSYPKTDAETERQLFRTADVRSNGGNEGAKRTSQ
jgi:hypothetical protein